MPLCWAAAIRCPRFRSSLASNMFHVHFAIAKEQLEPILVTVYEQTGVGLTASLRETGEASCFFEMHIGDRYGSIPKAELGAAVKLLDQLIKQA